MGSSRSLPALAGATDMSSPFRFVTSNKRGQYSVWRGDTQIGYVEKIEHRVYEKGELHKRVGWVPTTMRMTEMPTQRTQKDAARALSLAHQAGV